MACLLRSFPGSGQGGFVRAWEQFRLKVFICLVSHFIFKIIQLRPFLFCLISSHLYASSPTKSSAEVEAGSLLILRSLPCVPNTLFLFLVSLSFRRVSSPSICLLPGLMGVTGVVLGAGPEDSRHLCHCGQPAPCLPAPSRLLVPWLCVQFPPISCLRSL